MTEVEEFQRKHGAEWAKIVGTPAFADALLLLNVQQMKELIALTPEQIKQNGVEILAGLVAHLKHENALITLHEKRIFKLDDLSQHETYEPDEILPSTGKGRKKKS